MNKFFFHPVFLFFLFSSFSGFTQNWQIGLKGGLSVPNLPSSGGSDVSKGYKSISGPDFALVADYRLSENMSLESGLEWSTQGGQKSGLQTIPASPDLVQYFPPGTNSSFLYANFTSTVRLQYLMLPVLFKYSMHLGSSGHWQLYGDAGVFGAIRITAKASAAGSSKVYFDKAETQQVGNVIVKFDSVGNINNQLHAGNFGVEANIGILYQMNSSSFLAEVGGNYGFVGLQKSDQNGTNHTGALCFRIGYLFKLND